MVYEKNGEQRLLSIKVKSTPFYACDTDIPDEEVTKSLQQIVVIYVFDSGI